MMMPKFLKARRRDVQPAPPDSSKPIQPIQPIRPPTGRAQDQSVEALAQASRQAAERGENAPQKIL